MHAYVVLRQPEIGELVFGVPAPRQRRVVLVHHRVQALEPVLALLAERAGCGAIDGRRAAAAAADGRAAVRVHHGRVAAAVRAAGRHLLYRRRRRGRRRAVHVDRRFDDPNGGRKGENCGRGGENGETEVTSCPGEGEITATRCIRTRQTDNTHNCEQPSSSENNYYLLLLLLLRTVSLLRLKLLRLLLLPPAALIIATDRTRTRTHTHTHSHARTRTHEE